MTSLRSILFGIAFPCFTGLACVLCLPGLFLPRKQALIVVKIFVGGVYWLERHILKLDYEVRGLEYLPAAGPYIIAAKHESAYETMKLHILFNDPAVILKRELLRIPLWGRFLAKAGPIAIDRAQGREAIEQVIAGALRVKGEGRPIVIFPQGTRVMPAQPVAGRPYKIGIARMAEAAGLPVIPMALNSGMFWPRRGWRRYPGRVVFQFLPPVDPALDPRAVMADLETRLEGASRALAHEAVRVYHSPVESPA